MSTNRYIDKIKAQLAKEVDKRMRLETLLGSQVAQGRALLAERDALAKDAERYRWLRDAEELPFNLMKTEMMGATLDAAIDAALQGEQP